MDLQIITKTNAAAAVTLISTILALVFGDNAGLTPDVQDQAVGAIVTIGSIVTIIFRTISKKDKPDEEVLADPVAPARQRVRASTRKPK